MLFIIEQKNFIGFYKTGIAEDLFLYRRSQESHHAYKDCGPVGMRVPYILGSQMSENNHRLKENIDGKTSDFFEQYIFLELVISNSE